MDYEFPRFFPEDDEPSITCPTCLGNGVLDKPTTDDNGKVIEHSVEKCPECDGYGFLLEDWE